MEKLQKYLPTPLVLLAFIVSFITVYSNGAPILQDPDMGWHIAAGDLIRNIGGIPARDVWSFSGSDQTWYNLSWLWDIVLSYVHDKVGIQGLFVFANALPALLVALLIAGLQKRGGIGINALIFTGMIATYSMLEFATGRPQIIAMFLAFFFYNILYTSRSDHMTWKIGALPFLMMLWVNIHGSFFVGFIVIGAYGVEVIYSTITALKLRAGENKITAVLLIKELAGNEWFIKLFQISILCALAILVNPYGLHVITGVLRTMGSVIVKYVFEWQPFVFGSFMGPSLWLLVFVIFGNFRDSRILVADKVLAVICLVAMFFSVRNIGFLSVLGAPYIALNLPADNQKDSNTRKISVWINNKKFSPAAAVLAPVVLLGSYFLLPVLGTEHYLEHAKESPMPAVNYVKDRYRGAHVLNDWNFGGRIIYETRGSFPVFLDGRAGTVYTENIMIDYLAFVELEKDWQKILEPYHIDVLLLGNGRGFVKDYDKGLYRDSWMQVYHDEVATVYIRKNQPSYLLPGMDNRISQFEAFRRKRAMDLLLGLYRKGRRAY